MANPNFHEIGNTIKALYLFRRKQEESTETGRRIVSIHDNRSVFTYNPENDYINHKDICIGSKNIICTYCMAKKWPGEYIIA